MWWFLCLMLVVLATGSLGNNNQEVEGNVYFPDGWQEHFPVEAPSICEPWCWKHMGVIDIWSYLYEYLYGARCRMLAEVRFEYLRASMDFNIFQWIWTVKTFIQWSQLSYHSVGIEFDFHPQVPFAQRSLSHEASWCIGPSPQPVLEATKQQVLNCLLSKNHKLVEIRMPQPSWFIRSTIPPPIGDKNINIH